MLVCRQAGSELALSKNRAYTCHHPVKLSAGSGLVSGSHTCHSERSEESDPLNFILLLSVQK